MAAHIPLFRSHQKILEDVSKAKLITWDDVHSASRVSSSSSGREWMEDGLERKSQFLFDTTTTLCLHPSSICPGERVLLGFVEHLENSPAQWFTTSHSVLRNIPYIGPLVDMQDDDDENKNETENENKQGANIYYTQDDQQQTQSPKKGKPYKILVTEPALLDAEQWLIDGLFFLYTYNPDILYTNVLWIGGKRRYCKDDSYLACRNFFYCHLQTCTQRRYETEPDFVANYGEYFVRVFLQVYKSLAFLGALQHPLWAGAMMECFWRAWNSKRFSCRSWTETLERMDAYDNLLGRLLEWVFVEDIARKRIPKEDKVYSLLASRMLETPGYTLAFRTFDQHSQHHIFRWYIVEFLFGRGVTMQTLPIPFIAIQIPETDAVFLRSGMRDFFTSKLELFISKHSIVRFFQGVFFESAREHFEFCKTHDRPRVTQVSWPNSTRNDVLQIVLAGYTKTALLSVSAASQLATTAEQWLAEMDEKNQPFDHAEIDMDPKTKISSLFSLYYALEKINLALLSAKRQKDEKRFSGAPFRPTKQVECICLALHLHHCFFTSNAKFEKMLTEIGIPLPDCVVHGMIQLKRLSRPEHVFLTLLWYVEDVFLHKSSFDPSKLWDWLRDRPFSDAVRCFKTMEEMLQERQQYFSAISQFLQANSDKTCWQMLRGRKEDAELESFVMRYNQRKE